MPVGLVPRLERVACGRCLLIRGNWSSLPFASRFGATLFWGDPMKKLHTALVAGATVLLSPSAAIAQIAPVAQPAVSPIVAPPVTGAVLRVGTEVPLRLKEELTTK